MELYIILFWGVVGVWFKKVVNGCIFLKKRLSAAFKGRGTGSIESCFQRFFFQKKVDFYQFLKNSKTINI